MLWMLPHLMHLTSIFSFPRIMVPQILKLSSPHSSHSGGISRAGGVSVWRARDWCHRMRDLNHSDKRNLIVDEFRDKPARRFRRQDLPINLKISLFSSERGMLLGVRGGGTYVYLGPIV